MLDIVRGGGFSEALAHFPSSLSTDGWKLACVHLAACFLLDLFFNLVYTSSPNVNIPMTETVTITTTIVSQCDR